MILPFSFLLLLLPAPAFGGRGIPRYDVNLMDDPYHRWDRIIEAHKQYLPGVIEESKKYIPEHLQPFVWYVTKYLDTFFPTEYRQELEGIARASELPLGEIVGLNILYDITAFDRKHILGLGCTSIIVQSDEGNIYHGRNLDYEMTELLKNISIYVDFHKDGIIHYSAVTFPLYNGILTGQNTEFTVSLNARFAGPYIENILMELYLRFKRPVSYLIRDMLATVQSYDEAMKKFSEVHLFSPSYIILAGTKKNEGAIISRNRWRAVDVHTLDDDQWFLVETNFDNWNRQGDERRIHAIKQLKELGRFNLTEFKVIQVLATPPVKNDLTIFSCIMSAQDPRMLRRDAFIWDNTDVRTGRRLFYEESGVPDPLYDN